MGGLHGVPYEAPRWPVAGGLTSSPDILEADGANREHSLVQSAKVGSSKGLFIIYWAL